MTIRPQELINNPFLNKGTAFSTEEREQYGLDGLLPPQVETISEQAGRMYTQYAQKSTALEKRLFLMTIFNTNRTLFFFLMKQHLAEFMPIVYDPTVADSIEQYNEIYTNPQQAAFLSIDDSSDPVDVLKNAAEGRDIRLIVVTDSEAILGIGDWGVNGVDIAIGKLMVYTAAAGVNPAQVLPVVLDVGTNNPQLLHDPLYLGNRHARVNGERYDAYVDRFVQAVKHLFPKVLLHWEDFGRAHAAALLNKYKDELLTFNDDIQGTGIVTLAGLLGAMNISKQHLTDQIIMIFGAGTAGVGIAEQILDEMQRQGLSAEAAKARFYLIDKQGLLLRGMENLTPGQNKFARDQSSVPEAPLNNLQSAVHAVHPTVLIGTSTQPGAFSEAIIRDMAAHTARPVIFPLSNPTKLAEAKAADLIHWTDGRALIATGIPAESVDYQGTRYAIGQANNALMYPGLGFGLIAATAKRLNGEVLSQASHALGGIVDSSQPGAAVLPPVTKLAAFSHTIAEVVGQSVIDQRLNREPITDIKQAVAHAMWHADYTPVKA